MKAIIGVSNRHIHLNETDFRELFGETELAVDKYLLQPGQYSSNLKVTIKTDKNIIKNVRVVGPLRNYTQLEISKTDSYTLGIKPPVRESGDLSDAVNVLIIGTVGQIERNCCIIPERHIHISTDDRIRLGLLEKDSVYIYVGNEKKAFLENVYLKESKDAKLEIHLDTDDANSNFIKTGDYGVIISSNTTSSPEGSVPFK